MAKLIFGCGYLGQRVAQRWLAAGDDVFVVTRDESRAHELAQEGYAPILADVTRPESLADLPQADTVLYAIGYDRAAGHSMHAVYVDGLQAALAALPPETGKLIYTSSTGVYAQSDGQSVDEDSPTVPQREGGLAALAAEQLLHGSPFADRSLVLRLAGLYGPGRIPYVNDIRAGLPIAVPESGLLNLIHVDDAASVVMAAEACAAAPRTYVVSDGHPVERREYFHELSRLLGAPAPQFAPPEVDSPAAKRAAGSKRINNARMAGELRIVLKYPSYRDGLAAIVAELTHGASASRDSM